MMEEPPTDYYYDRLSEDLRKRHPQADSHLIDHLVSLEAFLDKSILFGFSFGINKAEVAVAEGKLLGHKIGRSGSSPDEERCQAVVDFPPLREKLHIQQFLGCANWLRGYLPAEYGHAAKVLGQWQKPGAEFPEGGLGAGATAGCKAFKAIKQMMQRHICLASFDEAAAADGSCPLEQIADASGIAVGGSVLQMTRDLSRVKVLMTHSKSLTPAQQNWPPLIQEAFAQLEVKRATRRTFGSIRTVCWTDHANLTRAQTSDIGLDPKLVRWVGEILLDGSEIRSLSGRSATLGDSFSRNPKDRDRLLEARTRDLQGMSGRLRGFDLDQYLGEGTEGTGPVPWAVGSDAVPDTADRAPVAVPVAVATEAPVRVMVVFDYLRWSEQDAALVEIQSAFQRSLPGLSVAMRGCWGPFEDSEGLASHFDGGANRLAGTKRVKRLRVDLLTSCAKVLREATGFKPQFLVGLGQGGLVAAVLRWPLVVELTLQARNLQRKEARAAGEAWAGIKAIWAVRPRLWRTQSGHQEIAESCPELQREFPEPPLRGFGVVGKIAAGDEVLRLLRLDPSKGIEEASVRGMLAEPSREMWDHDGLCACGKRTYLFSRCPACIEQEALDTAGLPKGRTSRFAGLRTATRSPLRWASKLTGSWRRESALGACLKSRLRRSSLGRPGSYRRPETRLSLLCSGASGVSFGRVVRISPSAEAPLLTSSSTSPLGWFGRERLCWVTTAHPWTLLSPGSFLAGLLSLTGMATGIWLMRCARACGGRAARNWRSTLPSTGCCAW